MGFSQVTITTAGTAGSATGSGTTGAFRGTLGAIKIDYTSMPATCDLVITEANGLGRTILTLTGTNTDKVVYPAALAQGPTGADLTAIYVPLHLNGPLTIAVTQADAGVIVVSFDVESD